MTDMGARKFYPMVVADEVEGLENFVDPWIEKLWPALDEVVERSHKSSASQPKSDVQQIEAVQVQVEALAIQENPRVNAGYVLPLDFAAAMANVTALTGIPKMPVHSCVVEFTGNKKPLAELKEQTDFYVRHAANGSTESLDSTASDQPVYHATRPFMARLKGARCLTTADAVKRTLHVALDICDAQGEPMWPHRPGDSFGVLALNNDELVLAVIEAFKLDPEAEFKLKPVGETAEMLPSHVRWPCTVYELFRYCLDLTGAPRKAFFRILAEYSTDVEEKQRLMFLCSRQGSALMKDCLEMKPTLLDYLQTFSHSRPPLNVLLDVIAPLHPRYYSITNSSLVDAGSLHCAFNVVQYKMDPPLEAQRMGVCTPWLDQLTGKVSAPASLEAIPPDVESLPTAMLVPIFPRPNKDFVVPENTQRPWILIGPGTGIAPFLGFCQHRQQRFHQQPDLRKEAGEVWVFYGCRHRDRDYLFHREWKALMDDKVVTRFVMSCSRDVDAQGQPPQLKYVQHQLRFHAADVVRMMTKENGMIFVCGDAKGMAKEVNEALADILVQEKVVQDVPEALKMLALWMQEHRYNRDIWA